MSSWVREVKKSRDLKVYADEIYVALLTDGVPGKMLPLHDEFVGLTSKANSWLVCDGECQIMSSEKRSDGKKPARSKIWQFHCWVFQKTLSCARLELQILEADPE